MWLCEVPSPATALLDLLSAPPPARAGELASLLMKACRWLIWPSLASRPSDLIRVGNGSAGQSPATANVNDDAYQISSDLIRLPQICSTSTSTKKCVAWIVDGSSIHPVFHGIEHSVQGCARRRHCAGCPTHRREQQHREAQGLRHTEAQVYLDELLDCGEVNNKVVGGVSAPGSSPTCFVPSRTSKESPPSSSPMSLIPPGEYQADVRGSCSSKQRQTSVESSDQRQMGPEADEAWPSSDLLTLGCAPMRASLLEHALKHSNYLWQTFVETSFCCLFWLLTQVLGFCNVKFFVIRLIMML